MTRGEMSIEFDLLYNNITSNLAPGLDNYEKSRFLTIAQEEIVREYYNGISPLSNSFEKNEAVRKSLAVLVKTYSITTDSTIQVGDTTIHPLIEINFPSERPPADAIKGIADKGYKSYMLRLPEDMWFMILEYVTYDDDSLKCFSRDKEISVQPVRHDEYLKIKDNPFKGPNLRRVIRFDLSREARLNGGTTEDPVYDTFEMNTIELVSKYSIWKYVTRYMRKPKPIIIEDISGSDVPINGYINASDCELSDIIHRDIVERAVQLASIAYKGMGQK